MRGALRYEPSDYIGGRFVELPGDELVSHDPAEPSRQIWRGAPKHEHIDMAVAAARAALPAWSAKPLEERAGLLRRWQQVTAEHAERVASIICDEMGKTLAECRAEAKALGDKVEITLDPVSMSRVAGYDVPVTATRSGLCRFKPHGVMAVIGPFNFPAHLPNGHFVPALLMGDTVVVKPSEKTPGTGQILAELMDEAGCPPGVFNVVQGAGAAAARLVDHDDIDGILFTGSWPVGRRILEANLDRPGRIIALEMGGNNPAIVLHDAVLEQAVVECARAGFATTGQRCTCTRRIIVERPVADRFIAAFCKVASTLVIGPGRSDAPVFMGPLVRADAVNGVLAAQERIAARGGRVLVEGARPAGDGHFVSPSVIEVGGFERDDEEIFGPLVQIAVAESTDHAIELANASRYGLAAAVFTSDDAKWAHCFAGIRAGCINRNTGTAGASSKLPFGGLDHSGNHRPAAAFAVDYCAYPVAAMIESSDLAALPDGMEFDPAWLG